uniref:Uncharacterized protein n=1 Tax=Cacopsylla melanoneura TaxID=428564 RepID=A0A8D9C148_9HEMI
MAEKNKTRMQMTESASRINKSNNAYKVNRVSNIQITDVVHTSHSKDKMNQSIELPEINESQDPDRSEKRFKDSIQTAIDAINMKMIHKTGEELEEDSIVNDQVADVSKVVAQMNSNTFMKKVASLCDQITNRISEKENEGVENQDKKDILAKLAIGKQENNDGIETKGEEYIGNGTGENRIPQKRRKLLQFDNDYNDETKTEDDAGISNPSVNVDKDNSISDILDKIKTNESLDEVNNKAEINGSKNNLYLNRPSNDERDSRMNR